MDRRARALDGHQHLGGGVLHRLEGARRAPRTGRGRPMYSTVRSSIRCIAPSASAATRTAAVAASRSRAAGSAAKVSPASPRRTSASARVRSDRGAWLDLGRARFVDRQVVAVPGHEHIGRGRPRHQGESLTLLVVIGVDRSAAGSGQRPRDSPRPPAARPAPAPRSPRRRPGPGRPAASPYSAVGGDGAAAELLGQDRQLEHASALAAVVLGDRRCPVQPWRDGQLRRGPVVDVVPQHPLADPRERGLALDDAAHRLAQELLLVGEGQVHHNRA